VPVNDDSTKASENGDGESYNNARRFTQTEKAVKKLPFKTFYTTNLTDYDGEVDNVQFEAVNRFEGRSSYFHYYPTDNIVEQK
jgi:hypothetical protein